VKKSLLSYIKHFFAAEDKVHAIDSNQEALNVVRSLCTTLPKGVIWRDARPYVLAEDLDWDDASGMAVITGTVRGKGLKADRLVHLQGYGDCQIDKICSTGDSNQDQNAMDTSDILEVPSGNQDSLDQFETEELPDVAESVAMSEPRRGVLLDDHHYFDDDEIDGVPEAPPRKRRLPPGTSETQAKWIIDSDTDSYGSEDDEDEEMAMEEDELSACPDTMTEGETMEPTEYDGKSEMFLDLSPEEERRQYVTNASSFQSYVVDTNWLIV